MVSSSAARQTECDLCVHSLSISSRRVFEEALSISRITEATLQLVIGLSLLADALVGSRPRRVLDCSVEEVRPGPKFSMMYSDDSIERNLSERGDMQHMHVREETWDVMCQGATDGERAAQCNLTLRAHLSEIRVRDVGQPTAECKVNDLDV